MDFKRKIAFILLGGLILGLFGSFSFLLGMETAVIKDFNGQIVQLTETQRTALRSCETLKHMIEDTGMQEVPFEGVMPCITNQNFQNLAHLIANRAYINQLAPGVDFLELFKFADYMKAPNEVLTALADHIYEPLIAKINNTSNEGEKENLELLYAMVESNSSFYPNFSSLIKDRRDLLKLGESPARLLLSFDKLGKKLRSLEGIEELVGNERAQDVKQLALADHQIQKFDFPQIKKAFPALTSLSLHNNNISHVASINSSNITINLRENPVQSITINNPRSLKKVQILVDGDKRPIVTFNQSCIDKCAAWFEALKAQSKVALNRPNMLKQLFIGSSASISCTFIGVFLGLAIRQKLDGRNINVEGFILDKKDLKFVAALGACGTALCGAFKMWNECNQIRQDLALLAYEDGDHVEILSIEPHEARWRAVSSNICPSKYAYNLFGKN